jgi:hypothetical protein
VAITGAVPMPPDTDRFRFRVEHSAEQSKLGNAADQIIRGVDRLGALNQFGNNCFTISAGEALGQRNDPRLLSKLSNKNERRVLFTLRTIFQITAFAFGDPTARELARRSRLVHCR